MAGHPSLFTYGFEAATVVPGQTPVVSVPAGATTEHMAWLLDRHVKNGWGKGVTVVIHSDRAPAAAVRQLDIIRSTLFRSRLVSYATAASPVAARILAGLAAAVGPFMSAPGLRLAALPQIECELAVLACLDSVARLDRPPSSVAQTAASMLPGSAFGVVLGAEPAVKRLSTRSPGLPMPEVTSDAKVVVGGRANHPEWVGDFVEPAFDGHRVEDVEVSEAAVEAWWGTKRVAEVVAHPTDVTALAERVVGGFRGSKCDWCGERVAQSPCPFCGQVRLKTRQRNAS